MDILVRSARVIDPQSPHNGKTVDILIEDGIITEIGKELNKRGVQIVEADNIHVSPGWFDMQVHACDPGFEYKEDLSTTAHAAAAGGFTGIATLPDTLPLVHSKSEVEYIINKVKQLKKNPVEVHPIGSISKNNESDDLAELYDMHQSGAIAFSNNKKYNTSAGLLLRALLYTKNFNSLVMAHCDEKSISQSGKMNEGVSSTQLGLKGIPGLAEELAVARNIYIAEYAESKIHLTGISTAKSVELIRRAKSKKINITASVNAYNLVLEDSLLKDFDSNYKTNPPLRTKADIDALRKGLDDGTIDCITSDHTPEDIENKQVEFDQASFGMTGIETLFALVNSNLDKTLSLETIIEKISINPRSVLNIEVPVVKEGAKANLTFFDPEKEWTYTEKQVISKSKNTPFIGVTFKGRALATYNKKIMVHVKD